MLEQIYLHIGLHKTGTTSIQSFLKQNAAYLESVDYVCKDSNGIDAPDGNSYFLVQLKDWFSGKRDYKIDYDLIIKNIKSGSKEKVLISSEAFGWVHRKSDLVKLKKILQSLAKKVTIVVYLRDPISFRLSILSEGAKVTNPLTVVNDFNCGFFDSKILNNAMTSSHLKLKNVKLWISVFGKENIIARPFEPSEWLDNNLICDFLGVVKESNEALFDIAHGFRAENLSLNKLQLFYMVKLHRVFGTERLKLQRFIMRPAQKVLKSLKCNDKYVPYKVEVNDYIAEVAPFYKEIYNELGIGQHYKINSVQLKAEKDILTNQEKWKLFVFFLRHMLELPIYWIAWTVVGSKHHKQIK